MERITSRPHRSDESPATAPTGPQGLLDLCAHRRPPRTPDRAPPGVLLGILNWDLWELDLVDELVRNTIFCCCIGLWSGLVLGLAAAVHRTATGNSP
ncbi:hypothetical protein ACFQ3Z_00175 [Streptomyces nogalater]